jgi:hypothetical protein
LLFFSSFFLRFSQWRTLEDGGLAVLLLVDVFPDDCHSASRLPTDRAEGTAFCFLASSG